MKFLNFFKNLNTEKAALYSGVALMVVLLLFMGKCNKGTHTVTTETQCPEWADIKVEFADSLNAFASTYSISETNPTPTDTIVERRIEYREREIKVTDHRALEELRAKYARIYDELNITKEKYDSIVNESGPIILTVTEPVESPPVVVTNKDEKTEEYEITERITSNGALLNYNRSIKVYPKTVTVTKTKTNTEYLKRANMLGIQAGALYLDDINNVYYSPSVMYGHKWWTLQAGPVLDTNWKYRGFEAKLGLVARFD